MYLFLALFLGGDLFLENIKVDLYDYLSWTIVDLFINGEVLQAACIINEGNT